MFHRTKTVKLTEDYKLVVTFEENVTKIYNVEALFEIEIFNQLKNNELFFDCNVDKGGYGIVWSDEIDLSCDEIYQNGKSIISIT